MQEVAIKLPSMVLYAKVGGIRQCIVSIATDLRERSGEWLQLAVPSCYTRCRTLCSWARQRRRGRGSDHVPEQNLVDCAFSILILGKKLTPNQWIALACSAGIVAVQGVPDSKTKAVAGT